jgi:hypothetical protein
VHAAAKAATAIRSECRPRFKMNLGSHTPRGVTSRDG